MFSNGSGNSISLLTVTPSFVTVGPPKLLSRITFRPVGPSVIPTACASLSAPCRSFLRASSVYKSCLAIFVESPEYESLGLFHDLGENVALSQDLDFFAVHFDVIARVTAVEHFIALGHGRFGSLAVFQKFSGTYCQHPAALRLLFRSVRQQNPAGRLFLCLERFHDDTVVQRPHFQVAFLFLCHGGYPFRISELMRKRRLRSSRCRCVVSQLHVHAT